MGLKAVDAADQGRFAGPGGTTHHNTLTFLNGKRNVLERLKIIKKLGNALHRNEGRLCGIGHGGSFWLVSDFYKL